MFKLIVNGKNGREESEFNTEAEAQAHYDFHLASGYWGENAFSITQFQKSLPSISPRQIRLSLLSLGITEVMVDGAIAVLPSPDKDMAMIAWKHSTAFERNLDIVNQLGSAIGLNSTQLDQLWILGATL